MKKSFVFILLALLLVSFVVAVDVPSVGVNSSDVEAVQGVVDELPFDDSGNVNFSKYNPMMSNAEIRIMAINLWLEENAVWLKAVFGMVPSITWLFAFVFYWWLFFLAQALNGVVGEMIYDIVTVAKESRGDPTEHLDLIPLSMAQIIGLVLFGLFLLLKIPLNIGKFSYNTLSAIYNYGWIGILVIVVVFVVIMIFFPNLMKKILLSIRLRVREKEKRKESVNRQVLDKVVKGMMGK